MSGLKSFLVGAADRRSSLASFALLLLRVFAGLSLALGHGFGKLPASEGFIEGVGNLGFPAPALFAWAAALSESVGGILLALGLLTRPAALGIFCTMAVAAFIQHASDPYHVKELALFYGTIGLVFLLIGAGRFSLDALIRRN